MSTALESLLTKLASDEFDEKAARQQSFNWFEIHFTDGEIKEYGVRMSRWQHQQSHARMSLLVEICRVQKDALEKVKAKQGMCIFGSLDTSDIPDVAFRQGSAYAFAECAETSIDALAKVEAMAKEQT